jgi:hypothetical protein
LGDIKWVLYQYICDLGGDKFSFRCGNYAYNKISSMSGFTESKLCTVSGSLNLNGEYIYVTNIEDFDKKMVVISHKVFNDGEIHKEINNDDIVLYFA